MRSFLFVWLVMGALCMQAQNNLSSEGARAYGMGGIQTPLHDAYSAFGNQAGLAGVDAIVVGAFFENKFAVEELSRSGLVVAAPTSLGTFAFAGTFFGSSLYSETLLGLAYGRTMIPKYLRLGIKMNYYQLHLGENLGNRSSVTAEFGVQSSPVENLTVGLHLDNPFPQSVTENDDDKLPTRVKIGASYSFGKHVLVAAEADKDLEQEETNFKAGIEFSFLERFYMRAGINSFPAQHSFGVGLLWSKVRADLSFARHSTLGYSPKFGLSYGF